MAWDIGTKKTRKSGRTENSRWFRLGTPKAPEFQNLDHLMDMYWGGPERRLTGTTVRIIGVNAVALLILMFGILYLGQYQNSLINARLETFKIELELISITLSQSTETQELEPSKTSDTAKKLSLITKQHIVIFNQDGTVLANSKNLLGPVVFEQLMAAPKRETYKSIETLKNMTSFIIGLLPEKRQLPAYPFITEEKAENFPGGPEALQGKISLSAWERGDSDVFLSAAAPILKNDKIIGAVILNREGHEIKDDIGRLWIDVLKIFGITLLLTTMLSIYLSGTIARPLKRLANAAESVRRGKARAEDIPDLSHRYDEIGELSTALRQMTRALWERMDSIEQFAADVSHELKNPLTSLKSAVETASIVKKPADRKKLLDIIKHDVERLDRLISDISNASKIDAELSREEFEKIDLRNLLHNLLSVYSAPLDRSLEDQNGWKLDIKTDKATLHLADVNRTHIEVWGFETRLAQVFQNLIDNALSFTRKNSDIHIFITPMRGRVSIAIEDNGPGIPPAKLENVFERFYSERPEAEGYGHHSGLGLSICKQIIDAHGGNIMAENITGDNGQIKGARFTVILNTVV